jgi:multimeric flavodoxin WrbA
MKITILLGSPRKGGNTEILADKFLDGVEKSQHTFEKVYLYKQNIQPCIACDKCKKGDYTWILKDDMQHLYGVLDDSDLIVIGTPNYWFGPTAKTKLFVDRMRPYTANKKLKGKKAALIIAAADGEEACEPMIKMFKMSFDYLNVEFIDSVVGTAYTKKEILEDKKAMKHVFELGKSI